jgi:hypothetical protein
MDMRRSWARQARYITLALLACLGAVVADAAQTPASGGKVSGLGWQRDSAVVALLKDGKPVWQFNYSPALSKPYFHPLALAGGSNLAWLSPPDHPWHLALFFSWKYLNRVNYWEETAGVASGATKWSNVKVETRPDFSASIAMDLQYRPQGAAYDVLAEKRRIRISPPAPDRSFFMDWYLEFIAGDKDVVLDRTPPDTKPDGNARGGYAGLSIRLAKELSDPRITATADIGTMQRNRYGFAAKAADFNGEIDGIEAGVAMLDHPSNLRSPSRWYGIMDKSVPFWFLNASLLQLDSYTLPAGQKLVLRYRVFIHSQRWESGRLEKEHTRYIQGAGKD